MTTFDSYETEQRYYKVLHKLGIIHISWSRMVTMEDVISLEENGIFGDPNKVTNEEFIDFP